MSPPEPVPPDLPPEPLPGAPLPADGAPTPPPPALREHDLADDGMAGLVTNVGDPDGTEAPTG